MNEKAFPKRDTVTNFSSRKPMVVIDHVSKQFEGVSHKTIDDVSLTIYEGELFALLGPSGCGKTTLMRMLAGFESPSAGTLYINGQNIAGVPPYALPVNMMFQSYALFPHMNVEQNIAFGLKQEKLPKEEIEKRVKAALDMVKMTSFAQRKPRQLSGGQQQRVALARSLVKRPKLLLLDEPLGALDKKNREHTQMELINIQNMLGITFVMVTHDQEEAMAMANRIGIMGDGHLLQVGTPEEIYEYPNCRFVADFIGSINMFEGRVAAGTAASGFVTIQSSEASTDIIVQSNANAVTGSTVWVGVRPEEMELSLISPADNENRVEGTIIDIAFLGDLIFYHVKLANGRIIHTSVPTAARNKNMNLSVGNHVFLSWYHTDGVLLLS